MAALTDYPLVVFIVSLFGLWLSAQVGVYLRKKLWSVEEEERNDLATLETATLTLLGLIVAFSFSMAISRYDKRKDYEANEANAIGTEYYRATLLPEKDRDIVQALLKNYLQQRLAFYESRSEEELQRINQTTNQLELKMWSTVQTVATAQPTPPVALV